MNSIPITIIGGGNMALNLVGGICASGYPASLITVSGPHLEKLEAFNPFQVNITTDNLAAASTAQILILAVKPGIIKTVCDELRPLFRGRHPLIISVASGISLEKLSQWLGEELPIVRAMPNVSSKVLHGISGLCANRSVNGLQKQQAEELFKTVGMVSWFENEQALHAITALSGSGPAYYFLFMQAVAEAGIELGLAPELAYNFSIHTALGAAKLAAESPLSLEELRAQVTSPKGTTERAIAVMETDDIRQMMRKALKAAYQRSIELSDE